MLEQPRSALSGPSHCCTGSGQYPHTKQPAVRAVRSGAETRASEEALLVCSSFKMSSASLRALVVARLDVKMGCIPSLDKPPFL